MQENNQYTNATDQQMITANSDEYPGASAPHFNQMYTAISDILNDVWKQTEVNLCLLVEILKEKKPINEKTIQTLAEEIKCESNVIAHIFTKIKKTMKILNKGITDEQIIDRLLAANISLIKKYIKIYTKIAEPTDKFLNISNALDSLPNQNQGEDEEQSQFGSIEGTETIIELFAIFLTTAQIAGKKQSIGRSLRNRKSRSRKSRKSRKSKSRKRSKG